MNGKFDKMNETINSLTQFKGSRADFRFSKDQSNRAESKTGYVNACFHCAKPNHRFGDCRSATDADKNAIKDSLKASKEKNIIGSNVTPFLLKEVNRITKGESSIVNVELIKNNAIVGAKIAISLYNLLNKNNK